MKITVNKIDAAKRQLREAIRLWFTGGDIVAVHSLACSAHQIVHDINQKNGGQDLIYDTVIIKDEYRKEWIKKIKSSYNFLKHADNDPDVTIDLDSDTTEFFILFTLLGLERIGCKHDDVEGAFLTYWMLTKPSLLTEKGRKILDANFPLEVREYTAIKSKADFYQHFISVMNKMRA